MVAGLKEPAGDGGRGEGSTGLGVEAGGRGTEIVHGDHCTGDPRTSLAQG